MSYIMEPYDLALQEILDKGIRKENRTGIDTLSIAGMQKKYYINDRFPILTKRKVWPKSIFAELVWFLSGSTNNKDLQALGSNIWTPWVDPEFEKKNGFVEGALGPIYGFQLRHFGGNYGDGSEKSHAMVVNEFGYPTYEELSYGYGGIDQLELMVNTLKTDPNSRSNLFSLWNPRDLSFQRLPCCHYTFQVFVNDDKLSGMLTQRSCDMFIGGCANIQFYSALIYMLAQQTGYTPDKFIHSIGDAHIYINQIDAVKEYLNRESVPSPHLILKQKSDILEYTVDDFVLTDYNPLEKIKIPVAV